MTMQHVRSRLGWALVCASMLGLCFTAGCGSGRPRRVKVSGRVLIDGQPVTATTYGVIRLVPKDHRAAWGNIGKDGRFTLSTYDDGDGVVPGTHEVEVTAYEQVRPGEVRLLVPERYRRCETSDVTVTIDGPTDDLEVKLTWGQERPGTMRAETSGDSDPAAL